MFKKNNSLPESATGKVKKPIYKKWWFWVILILVLFFGGCISCSTGTTTESSNESDSTTNKDTKKEKDTYKMGDVIEVTTPDGKYKLCIDSVEEVADRNEFSDKQADRVIRINYSYENIDIDEDLYIFDGNFQVYDNDGVALETYPVDTTYPQEISAGRKTSASMAFALNNDTNHVEIEYYDNMFNSKKDCMIVLEW